MKLADLQNLENSELLRLYGSLMEELRRRKLIRSSNNPVSDYAEKLVCERMALSLTGKSSKGYDAIDEKTGIKYQIKARRLTRYNKSRQLGVIRNLNEALFDYLIGVIFDEDFTPIEIWQIPRETIPKYAKFSPHQNGHILVLANEVLEDQMVSLIFNQKQDNHEGREEKGLSKGGKITTGKTDFEKRNTHKWTEEDDIVTLYLFKYGDEDLPFSVDGISRKLGMSTGSLRMRVANFKAIDGQGGLDHFGKISERVYKRHYRTSKDKLKSLVLQILQKK